MNRFVEAARSLIGTRFRPQGRDAATGMDCAGLMIASFGLAPGQFRRDYRLRGDHLRELKCVLDGDFRRVARTRCRPGDVMVLSVARNQQHLAIRTPEGFVHADARLGRVTETPGPPPWPILAVYRRRTSTRRSS